MYIPIYGIGRVLHSRIWLIHSVSEVRLFPFLINETIGTLRACICEGVNGRVGLGTYTFAYIAHILCLVWIVKKRTAFTLYTHRIDLDSARQSSEQHKRFARVAFVIERLRLQAGLSSSSAWLLVYRLQLKCERHIGCHCRRIVYTFHA